MMLEQQYIEACKMLEGGCFEEAAQLLQVMLLQDCQSYKGYNKLGVAYSALHQAEEAKCCFRRALELNPSFAPSIVNMGNLALEEGEYVTALEHYQKALDKDMNYLLAYYNRAIAYKRLGHYSKYIAEIKKYKRCCAKALKEEQQQGYQELRHKLSLVKILVEFINKALCKRRDIRKEKVQ